MEVKISELNIATSAAVTDIMAIVTDPAGTPASKRIALSDFFKSLGLGSDANGDVYYRAAGVLARLPKGSEGQVLKIVSGLPAWGTNTAVAAAHAASHATGGTDELTPAAIGASATSHNHDATYAPIAKGVTNGDSHNHEGGDGGQIDHTKLSNIGTNTHSQIDSHIGSTSNPHSVTKAQVGLTNVTDDSQVKRSEMGAASGVATLDAGGKVPSGQIPALAISDTFVVASEVAMLALSTAEVGDVAVRSDINKTFILQTADPSVLGHWVEILTPAAPVQSVNGQTGIVSLDATDVGAAASDHNHSGVYEPVDSTLLREADLTGSGSATTPAKSDHNHSGTYQPAAAILTPNIQSYTPAGGATATLDLSLSNIHHVAMPAGNAVLALSNATVGQCFLVRILQDGGGSRTVTWPAGWTIRWAGGSAPTLTTTGSKADSFGFEVTSANTLDGFIIGQNI